MNKTLRRAVIAGNWKMNKTRAEARALIEELRPLCANASCGVTICVPYTDLETAVEACKGSNITVAAQNCHWAPSGAFTAEISAGMLAEMGVGCTIIGHSERRQYFGETDETVNKRVRAALDAGLDVILCVGELLSQREAGITAEEMKKIIVAYEPVWAIGTGKTATAQQAGEVCGIIRGVLASLYGKETADAATIQYGGSMNAKNAAELLAQEDVDGGLIGGASLKAPDFAAIIEAASK